MTVDLVLAIFRRVLPGYDLDVDSDFFTIGGDSLLATQIVGRVWQRFGVEIPFQALFERSTIAGLAETFLAGVPDTAR